MFQHLNLLIINPKKYEKDSLYNMYIFCNNCLMAKNDIYYCNVYQAKKARSSIQ